MVYLKSFQRNITLDDLKFVEKFDYKVKMLAISNYANNFQCSVEPWLIKKNHSLSSINGVLNAVEVMSNLSGPVLLTGAGAGGKPTASSVLSDVFDYMSKSNRLSFSNKTKKLHSISNIKPFKENLKFYLSKNYKVSSSIKSYNNLLITF